MEQKLKHEKSRRMCEDDLFCNFTITREEVRD